MAIHIQSAKHIQGTDDVVISATADGVTDANGAPLTLTAHAWYSALTNFGGQGRAAAPAEALAHCKDRVAAQYGLVSPAVIDLGVSG